MIVARNVYAFLAAIAIAVFLFAAWRHGAQVVDDAYIALRYAQNLVDGHGLVYNAGERVEGYTSIVFVLYAALCLTLGIDPIAAWKGLSLVAAVAALAGAARLERSAGPGFMGPPLSPILLLPLPAFAYWSFGTLEAMAFAGLLVGGTALSWREVETGRFRGAGPTFALAALTRPEGAVLFAVATVTAALCEGSRRRPDRRFLRRHAANVAMVSAVFAAHLLWRLAYYGDWRPNTYYAKVTGGTEQILTGLQYLGGVLRAFPVLAAAALALPLLLRRRAAAASGVAIVVAAVALAQIALNVGLGGDSQPFHRFFVPALPFVAVLAAWAARLLLAGSASGRTADAPAEGAATPQGGLASPAPRAPRWLAATAFGLLALHLALAHLTTQPYVAFVADRTTRVGAAVGAFFASRLEPEDMIATNTAGSLPLVSTRPALDMLGLADPSIARRPVYISSTGWAGHRRGWGEYVVSRHPRVILFYNTAGSREPFYLGDRELVELPGFRFYYRLREATLPPLDDTVSWPAARYPGFPFGRHPSGRIVSPDLGLEARFFTRPVDHTVFGQGPITVTWFERDRRDDALWSALGTPGPGDTSAFVDAVARRWGGEPPRPPGDPEARARVEAQCDLALQAIERGDNETARSILAAAALANSVARSPRVFRYVANLAAMTGDLHTALAAQKELLRLDPGDPLAQRNLVHLLTVPAAEFRPRAPRAPS